MSTTRVEEVVQRMFHLRGFPLPYKFWVESTEGATVIHFAVYSNEAPSRMEGAGVWSASMMVDRGSLLTLDTHVGIDYIGRLVRTLVQRVMAGMADECFYIGEHNVSKSDRRAGRIPTAALLSKAMPISDDEVKRLRSKVDELQKAELREAIKGGDVDIDDLL